MGRGRRPAGRVRTKAPPRNGLQLGITHHECPDRTIMGWAAGGAIMASVGLETMGRVLTTVALSNLEDEVLAGTGALSRDAIRKVEVEAIVDSEAIVDRGATQLVLPQRIVDQLGLPIRG